MTGQHDRMKSRKREAPGLWLAALVATLTIGASLATWSALRASQDTRRAAPTATAVGPGEGRAGPEASTDPRSPLPEAVLAAGVALALLLGGLVHAVRSSRWRVHRLEASSAGLEQRVRDAQQTETALREARRDVEARLAVRTADLDEATAEIEAFTYAVSHDLKSPLSAVLNFAAILEEDYGKVLDEEGRGFLARISTSACAATSMMDGMLAFSRLGREAPKLERIDTNALVRQVAADLCAGRDSAALDLQIGPLPQVHADAAMLRVVFRNLLSNALKFSSHRERPRIQVRGVEDQEEAIFTVQDNGVGFDARFSNKLFRLFERLHSSEDFEGLGVGLAVAARGVRRHRGRIWASSTPGEGASFHFSLPAPRR